LKRRSGVDGAKGSEKKPRNRLRSKKFSISYAQVRTKRPLTFTPSPKKENALTKPWPSSGCAARPRPSMTRAGPFT
jgi:hypothetical protein